VEDSDTDSTEHVFDISAILKSSRIVLKSL
jgi:hypothetical protein